MGAGVPEEVEAVPFEPIALFLKLVNELGPESTEFTAMTMPAPQWLAWRQYTQMGLVSLTRTVHVGKVVAVSATAMNPESNPTAPVVPVDESGLHGLANVLCVAVWFFWWNSNVMVSPGCA